MPRDCVCFRIVWKRSITGHQRLSSEAASHIRNCHFGYVVLLLLLCYRILWPADGRPAFVTESDFAYNQEMWARLRHIVIVMFQDPVAGRRPPCVCDGVKTSPTTRRCGLVCDTLLLLCSRILWPADGCPAFVTESRLRLQPGDVGSSATHCYCYVPGSCGRQTAALRLRRSQTSPTTRRCGLACDTLLLLCSRILWPADGRPAFATESDFAYNQEMWARLRHIVIVMFQDPVAGRRPPCVCDGVRLRLQPGDVGSPATHCYCYVPGSCGR